MRILKKKPESIRLLFLPQNKKIVDKPRKKRYDIEKNKCSL